MILLNIDLSNIPGILSAGQVDPVGLRVRSMKKDYKADQQRISNKTFHMKTFLRVILYSCRSPVRFFELTIMPLRVGRILTKGIKAKRNPQYV
jgi:hypothetical protein